MNLLAAEQRGINGTKLLSAASSGELTQMTPPLPLPLKGREREGSKYYMIFPFIAFETASDLEWT
jgi:hypothetical protein